MDTTERKNMLVKVINESGYDQAMLALSLNKKQPTGDMHKVAARLKDADGGHNKFLEFIEVWIDVTAPRYWWSQADTYRMSSKSSESTMHTLLKDFEQHLIEDFFESPPLPEVVEELRRYAEKGDLLGVKKVLPENFLQRRIWKMNYKTLRNIILQRRNHRLPHWREFCYTVKFSVKHPELLPDICSAQNRELH